MATPGEAAGAAGAGRRGLRRRGLVSLAWVGRRRRPEGHRSAKGSNHQSCENDLEPHGGPPGIAESV